MVFQAGGCTSGSLLGVKKKWHCNQAWLVHNTVSEAMERLRMLKFFGELNVQLPSMLTELVVEPDLFNDQIVDSNVLFIQPIRRF